MCNKAVLLFLFLAGGVLDCSAHGVPAPTIKWFSVRAGPENRKSLVFATNASDNLLQVLPHNHSLRFRPFAPSEFNSDIHSGHYQCQARSESGITLSRKVHVNAGKLKTISILFSSVVED